MYQKLLTRFLQDILFLQDSYKIMGFSQDLTRSYKILEDLTRFTRSPIPRSHLGKVKKLWVP